MPYHGKKKVISKGCIDERWAQMAPAVIYYLYLSSAYQNPYVCSNGYYINQKLRYWIHVLYSHPVKIVKTNDNIFSATHLLKIKMGYFHAKHGGG